MSRFRAGKTTIPILVLTLHCGHPSIARDAPGPAPVAVPIVVPQSSAVSTVTTGEFARQPSKAPTEQPARPPQDAVERDYQEGLRLLQESRVGEHYLEVPMNRALIHLKRAAEAGHLESQWLFGKTLFSIMFESDAPKASQRADYIACLKMLRIAALRGHPQALNFIPELAVSPGSRRPKRLAPPLDSIPRAWIERVFQETETVAR